MVNSDNLSLPLTGTGLALVAVATTPALVAVIAQLRQRTPKDHFYEDEDGKSTPESTAAFSNRLPKASILASSTIGFGTWIAVSVFSSLELSSKLLENWLIAGAWGLVLLHAISLSAHHSSVKVHNLGLWLLASGLVVATLTVPQLITEAQHVSSDNVPVVILRAVNVVAVISLCLSSVLLPRRPEVYFKNRKVDGQWTVSALSRYTWTWVEPLLQYASKRNDLDADDVPHPDRKLRSGLLKHDWDSMRFDGSLLRALLWAYKGSFVLQWSVTIFRNFLGLLPFWTMLRLINILEQRDSRGSGPSLELWILVFAMAAFNLLDAWVEGWVFWYSFADVSLPIRAQLSTLVFEKSLRRKNVKAAEKQKEATESQEADGDNKDDDESDSSSVLKSRQAIVNLVGVDAARIANFAAYQFLIINSVAKLVTFSFFLVRLIGWIPFAAGMLAWAATLPANTYFSKALLGKSEKLMKLRDEKLAVVNEALLGMRQIKFSALEARWEQRILAMRERELKTLWQLFIVDTGLFGCWVVSPILLAATSLAIYAIVNEQLLPSVAFVSIGIFKALEVTLGVLPELITMSVDTLVSIKRIDTYLQGPEMEKTLSEGSEVGFEGASIAWPVDEDTPDEDRFILRNLNFNFPVGELSVISGKTGTGKSLVLSAILGETDLLDGSIRVPTTAEPAKRHDDEAHPGNWIIPGSIAYVGQTPWLESASFRDNILFGLPLIEERYQKVIEVCALKKDLEILTDGDKTELGANGINLSGGQKWRVTLARAIYSRAEILVMDDVFSAVDAHVGRHIFEKCVTGDICKGRTRILVTHHVALVQTKAKFIIELGEGTALLAGLVSDLIRDGTLEEIKSHEQTSQQILKDEATDSSTAVNSEEASVTDETVETNGLQKVQSKDAKQFIQEEVREKGVVKKHVYMTYLRDSGGLLLWGICAVIFLGYEIGILGRAWWLRIWTGDADDGALSVSVHQQHGHASVLSLQQFPLNSASGLRVAESQNDLNFYLYVYIGISSVTAVIGTLRFFWAYFLAIKASRSLFEKMLFAVLHTPLRWLDTVPVGRVLNRFTSDFNIIDNRITIDWTMFISNLLSLAGVCVAAFFASSYVIPLAVVLLGLGIMIGNKYLYGARPLKRLESNCKSPVFELFNAALAGVSTIRGFQKTQVYVDRMYDRLDSWNIITSYMWLVNRWMGIRMAFVGTLFSTVVGIIVIMSPSMDAALAGFTLSFALDFAESILWTIRHYAGMELNMNSTERVVEYTELETESLEGEKPPAAWPTSGTMEVDNLEVAYAPDLPPVLKGISFNVKNNERIGVVGRTGAGKSSLTLALFRFLEARSGSVFIDGLDISKIDLHSLRSRLAIIPQDPVLFSGTIRSNLDPFDDNTDEELRDSLARVHLVDSQPATPSNEPASAGTSTLAPKNVNVFRDLSSPISESGGNLSQGQRQLLCLARAIVARPKIMVLDEATSAVDMATDALIQRSIREEFTDSTLLVIAHRLSTIADFDRILVLSEGRVAEFGTPKELWEKEGGVFRDMCESSGEKEKLRQTIFA
ncbi:P-loop containing nucleoside triphosphate hydrolase protein [Fusarium solani]|uniref:P-loop containing nucleoside triphosphate hydrolase protein n=1 Tax=Fusarium solani TaxID=169388 RepID=A0A9P9L3Z9_FUSSL|nr:P-loop containing nucleoside triphosphate hydrolase protein [Fusarium solani]KAH7273597.1 P-loop containing nucleoside triphosphate hydrolase protein [Fusarium solani]